jgi:hypothetical protein
MNIIQFGGFPPDENGEIEWVQIPGAYGFAIYSVPPWGISAHSIGDLNGDGACELDVTSPYHTILFGGPHWNGVTVYDMTTYDESDGFALGDSEGYGHFRAGDIDADGIDDVMKLDLQVSVGGRVANGRVWVGYGYPEIGATGSYQVPDDPGGGEWFEIWGAEDYENISPVRGIPDVNGDGIDDIALRADPLLPPDALDGGYILFGQRRFALGDFDRDRDVDMRDFFDFVMCYNGPLRPPAAGCPAGVRADFDDDGDVDLGDYATFSQNYTGAQ